MIRHYLNDKIASDLATGDDLNDNFLLVRQLASLLKIEAILNKIDKHFYSVKILSICNRGSPRVSEIFSETFNRRTSI